MVYYRIAPSDPAGRQAAKLAGPLPLPQAAQDTCASNDAQRNTPQ